MTEVYNTAGVPTGFSATPSSGAAYEPEALETIKVYVDARIREADLRYQQRYDFTQKASEKAADTLNTRLEAMNEFRGALADQAARTPTRGEIEALVNTMRTERAALYEPLRSKVEDMARTNWPVMVGIAAVALTLVTGFWAIVGLKIEAAGAPIATSLAASDLDRHQLNDRLRLVETTSTASVAADVASRTDRSQLNDRLRSMEDRQAVGLAAVQSNAARFEADQKEIEAQFKGLTNTFNTNLDHNEQTMAMLWEKLFPGQRYPATNFRPQFSK